MAYQFSTKLLSNATLSGGANVTGAGAAGVIVVCSGAVTRPRSIQIT